MHSITRERRCRVLVGSAICSSSAIESTMIRMFVADRKIEEAVILGVAIHVELLRWRAGIERAARLVR
jgi:hypothetical protein